MTIRIKKDKLINLLYICLFSFVIFAPKIKYIPHLSWIFSFMGLLTLLDKKFVNIIKIMSVKSTVMYILIGFSAIYSFLIPIIKNTNDLSYYSFMMAIILCLFRNFLIMYYIYKHAKELNYIVMIEKYLKLYVDCCLFYFSFTILFILFPSFKSFWLYDILSDVSTVKYPGSDFRYGLDGFAAFSSATLFSIAIIVQSFFLCNTNKYSHISIIKYASLIIAGIIYGRITFIVSIISIIYIILRNKSILKALKYILIIVSSAIVFYQLIDYFATYDQNVLYWKQWAFSSIENMFKTGKLNDYSTSTLINEMYFPVSTKTFLFGDGFYTSPLTGKFYMSTDAGFMRILLYSGFIGTVINFFPLFFMIYIMVKDNSNSFKKIKGLIKILMLVWLIMELKGEAYNKFIIFMHPIFTFFLLRNRRITND